MGGMVAGPDPVTPTGWEGRRWRPSSFAAIVVAHFYFLHSPSLDRLHIDHTTEALKERLREHLSDHRGWSARAKDWTLVHCEAFPDKAAAYRRELEVKRWKSRVRGPALVRM